MGVPGWPELAAWTASIESVRMVLMLCCSIVTGSTWVLIHVLLSPNALEIPTFLQHSLQALGLKLVPHQCAILFHLGVRLATGPAQFACHQGSYLRSDICATGCILQDDARATGQDILKRHRHLATASIHHLGTYVG